MKTISLKSIAINNFKGITNFKIIFDGMNTNVYGDNDAGKTSLYDAFLWAMFHKDSKDRSKFNWKPLDEHNKTIEGLQTSVTVNLNVDGKDIEFSKIKHSKKVMKRKLERSVYEDTTKYLIDGLETTTKQIYDSKVSEVVNAETFKSLSSITYFMNELMAKQRRESLFKYFGTKTDVEIIQETSKLHGLLPIVADSTVTDARAKTLQQSKRIDETLKNIPIKIEGIQSVMPEISELNRDELSTERQKLSEELTDQQDQLVNIKRGGSAGEYRSQLRLKQTELQNARLEYEAEQKSKTRELEEQESLLYSNLNNLRREVSTKENELKSLEIRIGDEKNYLERLKVEHEKLVSEYDDVDDLAFGSPEFVPVAFDETKLACSYCGTEYQEERKEEMRSHHEAEEKRRFEKFTSEKTRMQEKFEADKTTKLEAIREQGLENNKETEHTEESIANLENKLKELSLESEKKAVEEAEQELATIAKKIEVLKSNLEPFEITEKYQSIIESINFYKDLIENSEETMSTQIAEQQKKIDLINESIQSIDHKLATFAELDRQQQTIEQLNEQERELSQQKGEILETLALFDEFFITKRDLLQAYINSHFSLVNWKLFEFSKEGNLIEDYCEPMINEVPYSDLNNGSQMQAGLDIANTLMQQEGYLLPIFIDNAEGMTGHKKNAVKVDTQMISLYVNEADKNLRVEKEGM